MSEVRVFELAKELNMPAKQLLSKMRKAGIPVTGNFSEMSVEQADIVRKMAKSATGIVVPQSVKRTTKGQKASSDKTAKENYSQEKLKKTRSSKSSIDLIKNPDIISSINKAGLIKVGFAAETQDIEINAKKKIAAKNLDFVVANDITSETSGFSSDNNKVIIIHSDDTIERLPLMPKYDVGNAILDRVKKGLGNINST